MGSYSSGKTSLIRSPTQTCFIGPGRISCAKPGFHVGRNEGGVALLWLKPRASSLAVDCAQLPSADMQASQATLSLSGISNQNWAGAQPCRALSIGSSFHTALPAFNSLFIWVMLLGGKRSHILEEWLYFFAPGTPFRVELVPVEEGMPNWAWLRLGDAARGDSLSCMETLNGSLTSALPTWYQVWVWHRTC